jgi:hypothetical protein
MPQIVHAMVQILLCPSLFPVDYHVFVAASGEEEMVQNRRLVFCENAVALLCKRMENAMKSPCFFAGKYTPCLLPSMGDRGGIH